MVGVARNVSEVPVHIVEKLGVTMTDGMTVGTTVITILLLVAVGDDAHGELEVMTHHTVSLLARAEVVNVALVLDCTTLFLYH